MSGLALAILIYFAVGAVWDIIEPDAVRVKFNNPGRGLFAAIAQAALIVLLIMAAGLSTAVGVAVGAILFALACLSAAADR